MTKPPSFYPVALLICTALFVGGGAPALACGYHDSASVSFKTSVLNWLYPNSLHVYAPIWRAQEAGALPPYEISRWVATGSERKLLDALAYEKVDRALRALGAGIGETAADKWMQQFSLVLVESALWTRFAVSHIQQIVDVNMSGPGEGDLVVVTGEPVIFAIGKGKLTLSAAFDSEMLKLYGEPEQIDNFLVAYGTVGSQPLPTPMGFPSCTTSTTADEQNYHQLLEKLIATTTASEKEKP